MWTDFDPENPYRPPHWRWERAALIASGQLPVSRKRDDEWVARAARFRRRLDNVTHPSQMYELAEVDRPCFWAYKIWAGRADEKTSATANILEARLLAAEPREEIARKSTVTKLVVDAYAAMFFDVSARLHCDDWIITQVLGPQYVRGIRASQAALLWKIYGWKYGPAAVDALTTQVVNPARAANQSELVAIMRDATRNQVLKQAMIAAHTAKPNDFNGVGYIEMALKSEEQRNGGGGSGGGQANETVMAAFGMMMSGLPVQAGDFRRGAFGVPAIDAADQTGVELRGNEMLALGVGAPVPELPALEFRTPERAAPEREPGPKKSGGD